MSLVVVLFVPWHPLATLPLHMAGAMTGKLLPPFGSRVACEKKGIASHLIMGQVQCCCCRERESEPWMLETSGSWTALPNLQEHPNQGFCCVPLVSKRFKKPGFLASVHSIASESQSGLSFISMWSSPILLNLFGAFPMSSLDGPDGVGDPEAANHGRPGLGSFVPCAGGAMGRRCTAKWGKKGATPGASQPHESMW